MASITLEYNARNNAAKRIIEVIMAMDNVFKVKSYVKQDSMDLTRKAIQDVEKGNVVACASYDDYLNQTAQYA
jgi:hypothetical protein